MKDQSTFVNDLTKKNYFEGWYYKHVTKDKKQAIAIIMGISTSKENPHAFIQIIENIKNKSYYLPYSLEDLEIHKNPFYIRLHQNYFYKNKIVLNINEEKVCLKGELSFSHMTPLKKTWYRPTIMGPFSYLKMECNHAILSLHHTTSGFLQYQNKKINFNDGTGYIEKDYGTSFPKQYLWISSNHANHSPSTFFFSKAHIPFLFTSFLGIICVLYHKGKQYFFTSYYGAHLSSFDKSKDTIRMKIKQGFYHLYIKIQYQKKSVLWAPKNGKMNTKIKESLDAEIDVTLYKKNKRIVREHFTNGGFEYVE